MGAMGTTNNTWSSKHASRQDCGCGTRQRWLVVDLVLVLLK
jgi:hypothetical protein